MVCSNGPSTWVTELVLFVVVPLTVAIVVERSVTGAIGTIAVATLAVVYIATSYGVVSISRFVLGRITDQLRLLGSITSYVPRRCCS